jgi:glutathione S-transferase
LSTTHFLFSFLSSHAIISLHISNRNGYLYVAANSHGCLAVFNHLKLSAKGQGNEIVNAYGATRTPEFLAMNPCHCCPTLELENDGNAIWESNAILRYLCVTQEGGEELYPADPVARAKIDMVLDWRQTLLYKCLPDIAYGVWGMEVDDDAAKKSFAELIETHFVTLLTVFLKDNKKYCYSDTHKIVVKAFDVIAFHHNQRLDG